MTTGPDDHHPDPLLEALAAALRERDPVPPEVVAAAHETFTWRTIDDELAALAYDSALDETLAGVRGAGPRALSFEAPDVVIEVEVVEGGAARAMRGQVVASGAARLELHHPASPSPLTLEVDHLGRFRADGVPAGPVRLRCRLAGAAGSRVVTTDWVVV
jgi:hypothetical protein